MAKQIYPRVSLFQLKKEHVVSIFTRSEWAVLAAIFAYSLVPSVGGFLRLLELSTDLSIMPPNPRANIFPIPIVLHILGSSIFCLFGAIQFLPGFRRRRPMAHRVIGRIVAIAGLVSALTAVWMTHVFIFPAELQGLVLYWARMVLGMSMCGLICWAIVAIRSQNIPAHTGAMLRAYAIGQGASTQAVLGLSWMLTQGTAPMGLHRDFLMVAAWIINLLAAEISIRSKTNPSRSRAEPAV